MALDCGLLDIEVRESLNSDWPRSSSSYSSSYSDTGLAATGNQPGAWQSVFLGLLEEAAAEKG